MLFLVHYFLLAAILVFQGLHILGEQKEPLGTLPEEVGLPAPKSFAWGAFLMTWGGLALVLGLMGFRWDYFVPMRQAILGLGWLILVVYAAWVIFAARRIQYMGTRSAEAGDHGHGHH